MYLKIAAVFGRADPGPEYLKPQLAEKNLNEDCCFWRIRVKKGMFRRIECRKRGLEHFNSQSRAFYLRGPSLISSL